MNSSILLLLMTGLFSGFVDSIAGGGGLITLPVLSFLLQPGATAIGTNKIAGACAAFVALLVFIRGGHMDFKKSLQFTLFVGLGSLCGSQISPLIPKEYFRWLLALTCPIILFIVWRKDLWLRNQNLETKQAKAQRIILSGFVCGIYDGAWGPGGGTFMLLSLIFFANLPLMTALAASKLANTCSATVALISYASGGYVHWKEGLSLALGISAGAFVGANFANRNAHRIVRPILAFVVSLLILKLMF